MGGGGRCGGGGQVRHSLGRPRLPGCGADLAQAELCGACVWLCGDSASQRGSCTHALLETNSEPILSIFSTLGLKLYPGENELLSGALIARIVEAIFCLHEVDRAVANAQITRKRLLATRLSPTMSIQ